MLLCAVLAISVYWVARYLNQDRLIEIDTADQLNANFTVDLNTASWPEIIVLPEIGETTARAIVAERERGGPFTDLDDMAHRVHGVGPRLLEQITPYVLPIRSPAVLPADAER